VSLNRRDALLGSLAVLGTSGLSSPAATRSQSRFPETFLWGAATAGHQVEGNNVNSDMWLLEHVQPTLFKEPSGDACDHYHRYRSDIALVASLGLNAYRFSLEWARIEPEPGEYSLAELNHYRDMLVSCHEHGLLPLVTINHFVAPRWFGALGGWEGADAADHFARYAEKVSHHLGDLIGAASTMNEPNIGRLLRWVGLPPVMYTIQDAMLTAAAKATASQRFTAIQFANQDLILQPLLNGHRRAYEALKAGPGSYPVGVSVALMDDQAVGEDSQVARKRADCYDPWFEAASHSDFIGVQTYSRSRLDSHGFVGPEPGVELTHSGEEFYPESLEHTIRLAAKATGKPVYVTENGIDTLDDSRRVAYIQQAVAGVKRCLDEGIDVRSYVHWSLLDNFEWIFGYGPRYGLVAVDRMTQERTLKTSAHVLGEIARHQGLAAAGARS
jgi:beta-glucosidase